MVGGKDLNGVSQHTVSCGPCKDLILAFPITLKPVRKEHFSREMLSIGKVMLCMLGENPSEEMMCANPI